MDDSEFENVSESYIVTTESDNGTSGPIDDEKIFYDTASALWKIGSTFALFVGGLLNILIIVTFSRKTLRDSLTSILFRLLAVADLIVILTHPLPAFLWFNFKIHTYTINITSCQIFTTLNNSSKFASAWLLVFIGFERVIAILFPHKIAIILRRKKILIAVAVVVCIGLGLAISSITNIIMDVQYNSDGEIVQKLCLYRPQNNPSLFYYVVHVYHYLDFCYYTGKIKCISLWFFFVSLGPK